MIKVTITLDQNEQGIAFELEQNGTNVTAIEDLLSETISNMIQTYTSELMNKLFGKSEHKHILN